MTDPPIIITNGSIKIEFDPSAFHSKEDGRLYNPKKRITRIEIDGESLNINQDIRPGSPLTIKIFYSSDIS